MGKLKYLALGAAGLAAVLSAPAYAQVVNGSFETNGGLGQFNFNTTASPWTVTQTAGTGTAGYAFIFGNSNAFSNTAGCTTCGSVGNAGRVYLWGTSADGSGEGSFFFGVDTTFKPSVLKQTVSGLTVGDKYTLSFEWAAAQQNGFSGSTNDHWNIAFGTQTANTPTVTIPSHGFSGWAPYSTTFTASSTSQTLSLTDIGTCLAPGAVCTPNASGGPPFSLIDSVTLTPVTTAVPEPSTWAMMLLGFAGLAYAGFRGRKTAISIVPLA